MNLLAVLEKFSAPRRASAPDKIAARIDQLVAIRVYSAVSL